MLTRVPMVAIAIAAAFAASACGSARAIDVGSPRDGALVQELGAIERQAWDAWKNGEGNFYRTRLLPDAVYLSGVGRESREAMAKQTEQGRCSILGFSLDSLAAHRQTADVALLTMHAAAEVKCGTRTIRSSTWGSTLFVKREGEWYITFHQETDTPPAKP